MFSEVMIDGSLCGDGQVRVWRLPDVVFLRRWALFQWKEHAAARMRFWKDGQKFPLTYYQPEGLKLLQLPITTLGINNRMSLVFIYLWRQMCKHLILVYRASESEIRVWFYFWKKNEPMSTQRSCKNNRNHINTCILKLQLKYNKTVTNKQNTTYIFYMSIKSKWKIAIKQMTPWASRKHLLCSGLDASAYLCWQSRLSHLNQLEVIMLTELVSWGQCK